MAWLLQSVQWGTALPLPYRTFHCCHKKLWSWMFMALEHVDFLFFLIFEILGVLWSYWLQVCCKWTECHSCHSSLSWHKSCKKSLKQVTSLCRPSRLKIDATVDSTLHFATAAKSDVHVWVMLLWTWSWSVSGLHSRPTVTAPSPLSSNNRCVSSSSSRMASRNVGG